MTSSGSLEDPISSPDAAVDLPDALHRATPAELKQRLAAERLGRPFLLYRDDAAEQRIVDLDVVASSLSVGRSDACDLALTWDDEVSRIHASLERLGGEWTLVDDGGSRNGSFVAGERVRGRRRLRDGDALLFGRTVIVFRNPSRAESLLTATSTSPFVPHVSAAQLRVLTALCRPLADGEFAAPATNREIADELVVSIETVKTHMHALFETFQLGDLPGRQKRAALAQRALGSRVVSL